MGASCWNVQSLQLSMSIGVSLHLDQSQVGNAIDRCFLDGAGAHRILKVHLRLKHEVGQGQPLTPGIPFVVPPPF